VYNDGIAPSVSSYSGEYQRMITRNLPQQPTSFIGKDQDIVELRALLDDPGCRLLTLVGSGGKRCCRIESVLRLRIR